MSIPTRLALVVITCFAPVAARAELAAIRPEFQVSTGPAYSAYYGYVYPHTEAKSSNHVAASPAGTFIVAWEDYYFQAANGTLRPGIFARRLDSLGRPLAGEFRASPLTAFIEGASHVASDDAGNFVVVWDETDQYYTYPADDSGTRIMARRFNASGGALGSSFLVNSYTPGYQSSPKVAFDGAGNFRGRVGLLHGLLRRRDPRGPEVRCVGIASWRRIPGEQRYLVLHRLHGFRGTCGV